CRSIDGESVIHLLVDSQLVVIKGNPGKQLVFFDQEVRHPHRLEEVILAQGFQLVGALEQEEQLGGQGGGLGVAVESRQKGVFLGLLEQHVVVEQTRQVARQGGFTH